VVEEHSLEKGYSLGKVALEVAEDSLEAAGIAGCCAVVDWAVVDSR